MTTPDPPLTPREQIVSACYDIVTQFPGLLETLWHHDEQEEMTAFCNRFRAGQTILDAGCGPGRLAPFFTRFGLKYTGIDVCASAIDYAPKLAKAGRFERMSFNNMTFAPNSFDAFWSSLSLMHEPKPLVYKTLASLRRVLHPDGYGCIIVPDGDRDHALEATHEVPHPIHLSFYRFDEFADALRSSDFKIVDAVTRPFCACGGDAHRYIVMAA